MYDFLIFRNRGDWNWKAGRRQIPFLYVYPFSLQFLLPTTYSLKLLAHLIIEFVGKNLLNQEDTLIERREALILWGKNQGFWHWSKIKLNKKNKIKKRQVNMLPPVRCMVGVLMIEVYYILWMYYILWRLLYQ
jgi:hypothetical protein